MLTGALYYLLGAIKLLAKVYLQLIEAKLTWIAEGPAVPRCFNTRQQAGQQAEVGQQRAGNG